jgi:hypothetical protein
MSTAIPMRYQKFSKIELSHTESTHHFFCRMDFLIFLVTGTEENEVLTGSNQIVRLR